MAFCALILGSKMMSIEGTTPNQTISRVMSSRLHPHRQDTGHALDDRDPWPPVIQNLGDVYFQISKPEASHFTRNISKFGSETRIVCLCSYVINHATRLYYSHLEALVRLVFSQRWSLHSSWPAIHCYSPIQPIPSISCLPKALGTRQMRQTHRSRFLLHIILHSCPPLMPSV